MLKIWHSGNVRLIPLVFGRSRFFRVSGQKNVAASDRCQLVDLPSIFFTCLIVSVFLMMQCLIIRMRFSFFPFTVSHVRCSWAVLIYLFVPAGPFFAVQTCRRNGKNIGISFSSDVTLPPGEILTSFPSFSTQTRMKISVFSCTWFLVWVEPPLGTS